MTSTTESQRELLAIQSGSNTLNKSASSEIIERHEIQGTPFIVIGTNNKWFISWGKYKMSDDRKTKEEAYNDWTNNSVKIILTACAIIASNVFNENNQHGLTT